MVRNAKNACFDDLPLNKKGHRTPSIYSGPSIIRTLDYPDPELTLLHAAV